MFVSVKSPEPPESEATNVTGTDENVVGLATVVGATEVGAAVVGIVLTVVGAGALVADVALETADETAVAAPVVAGAACFADAQPEINAAQMTAAPITLPGLGACVRRFIVGLFIPSPESR